MSYEVKMPDKSKMDIHVAMVKAFARVVRDRQRRHSFGECGCHMGESACRTSSGHFPECYTWKAAKSLYDDIFGGRS